MANRTVSLYVRNKGENLRAAPSIADPAVIYHRRHYDGPKQCWQKVGPYDFVRRAKLLVERQLSAKAQGFVLPENQALCAE